MKSAITRDQKKRVLFKEYEEKRTRYRVNKNKGFSN